MAIRDLNYRQKEVRKDIIRTRGSISGQALADKFHVTRTTIWRDRHKIANSAPIRGCGSGKSKVWDEEKEIAKARAEFMELHIQIYEEMEYAERALDTFAAEDRRGAETFRSVRVQLLGQARALLKDKLDFLLSVGYFRMQARKLVVATEEIGGMANHEVDAELLELAGILDLRPYLSAAGGEGGRAGEAGEDAAGTV